VAELLTGFAIAAADRKFVLAQAEVVDGTSVVVWAESVPELVVVRESQGPENREEMMGKTISLVVGVRITI
jgi:hypothetical protein